MSILQFLVQAQVERQVTFKFSFFNSESCNLKNRCLFSLVKANIFKKQNYPCDGPVTVVDNINEIPQISRNLYFLKSYIQLILLFPKSAPFPNTFIIVYYLLVYYLLLYYCLFFIIICILSFPFTQVHNLTYFHVPYVMGCQVLPILSLQHLSNHFFYFTNIITVYFSS